MIVKLKIKNTKGKGQIFEAAEEKFWLLTKEAIIRLTSGIFRERKNKSLDIVE